MEPATEAVQNLVVGRKFVLPVSIRRRFDFRHRFEVQAEGAGHGRKTKEL